MVGDPEAKSLACSGLTSYLVLQTISLQQASHLEAALRSKLGLPRAWSVVFEVVQTMFGAYRVAGLEVEVELGVACTFSETKEPTCLPTLP